MTGIHLALDVTDRVIDDALAAGANLIVTHHPLMFSARKRLTEADYEGHLLIRLIANGLSLIAAHTNLDQASGGMNDTLAGLLGLENIVGEGFLRVGDLSAPMTAEAFADFAARQLGDTVRVMGHREALIHRVGLCSGGGCDEWADAHAMGADAFLTGEVKHHIALDASYHGVVLLEAGHFATENPGIFALMKALQNAPDIVQWKMHISRSERSAYE